MAINVQIRGSKHQLRVTHALLPKPFFATFPTDAEARDYGTRLDAMLAAGVVPSELLAAPAVNKSDAVLTRVILDYLELAPVTPSDAVLLRAMLPEVAGVRVAGLTVKWAEGYLATLKAPGRAAVPGTIRKRIGALARVVDWHIGREHNGAGANILRLLPKGYSHYTRAQAAALGRPAPVDTRRDRRLAPGEEVALLAALAGGKRADRQRALKVDPEFTMLFRLIVDTGLRLSEAFRLRREQIDLGRRLIHVEGTKGARGVIKPRTVPIRRALLDELTGYLPARPGLVFPTLWAGPDEPTQRASKRLTLRFQAAFGYAGIVDMTEHDLRHEATCRWFELRSPAGGWVFSDIEVCRIMGWTSTNMALRYASLRGEDLSARLLD